MHSTFMKFRQGLRHASGASAAAGALGAAVLALLSGCAGLGQTAGQGIGGHSAAAPAAAASTVGVTPEIAGVVAAGTPIELIREGFTGTEGPIALADGSFAFTETNANRITRIAADGSTSTWLSDTNGANGLALTPAGTLYAVQVLKPRVGIIHPSGQSTVLADSWEGRPFGRPNDLVLSSRGVVYFTDSGANNATPEQRAGHARPAVYRILASGQLQRLADDIERPNGIQLSPDEKTLYVANTLGEHVLAYDIGSDGQLGPRRAFAKLAGYRKTETGWSSGADGLAVDAQGRLYVASSAGVQVFDSAGASLGVIALPKAPQNLAFSGPGKKTLYVVGRGAVYRIATLAPGHVGRAK